MADHEQVLPRRALRHELRLRLPRGPSEADRLVDLSWTGRAWNSFTNEEQAHIVDDWYGAHAHGADGSYQIAGGIPVTDLDSAAALRDPAFHFIRDNIRTGTI